MNKSLIFAVAAFTALTTVWAQEVLTVEDPRPLVAAIRILEEKYGWQINYEDPAYTDPKDWVDRTHPSYPGPHLAIGLRNGRLEISYSVSATTGKPDSPATLLQMLIDDHVRRDNPGRFQLTLIGDLYSVIPVQGSVLDVPITLPERQRTYPETLEEIVQAVSSATGLRVGGPGMYRPTSKRLRFGAKAEPARNVLSRLFKLLEGNKFSWHLLYSPSWGYALNVFARPIPVTSQPQPPKHQVLKQVKLPDGSTTFILVDVP